MDVELAQPHRDAHDHHQSSIASVLGQAARRHPERLAVISAEGETTWQAFDARARALGQNLRHRVSRGPAKVGVCLRSGPEFLESYFGCTKAALIPFNINFRYTAQEIAYLLDNADAEAVVVHREFAATMLEAIRTVPAVIAIYVVDDEGLAGASDGDDVDGGAAREGGPAIFHYEDVVGESHISGALDVATGPDDLVFLYTGGTTGMPKATMWRQGDLTSLYGGGLLRAAGVSGKGGTTEPPRSLSAAPMMHGTGLLSQLANLMVGGTVVVAPGRRFDAVALWDMIDRHRVDVVTIVGDPFAQPMLAALDEHPSRWDLTTLQMISSSGAMWSRSMKEGLLRHLPSAVIYDAFSASEGAGMAGAPSRLGQASETGTFRLGANARVLADDGSWVTPGSTAPGRVAASGNLPLGYYKDPSKTAETFMEIEGIRYAVPGDYVLVGVDGGLTLLGRGSGCINTGGEKVYPEEVEECLKEHPSVLDAAVLGIPDDRFGEVVCALVAGKDVDVDRAGLVSHVRTALAPYKVPRHIFVLDDLQRAPNGKLDRRHLAALPREELERSSSHQPL